MATGTWAAGFHATRGRAQAFEVDLALVLAIDCSYSVDDGEFRLQMEGLGRAFSKDDVRRAIRSGKLGRIAISLFHWSNAANRRIVLPWTILSGGDDTLLVSETILALPRTLAQGGTSISSALLFAQAMLIKGPAAERRVVDISSDGRNNTGILVSQVRDELVSQGTIINGLAILNEWPTLDKYFEKEVVGGEGHFVIPAGTYEDYADAIHRKLVREIIGPGMS